MVNFVMNIYSVIGIWVSELVVKIEIYMYFKVVLYEKKFMMCLFFGDDLFRILFFKCCNFNNYKYLFVNIYY